MNPKRRSRVRKSNTPPPPVVGRISNVPIPPAPGVPAEARRALEREEREREARRLVEEAREAAESAEDEEEDDRVSYEPTPALPPVESNESAPPLPRPREREMESRRARASAPPPVEPSDPAGENEAPLPVPGTSFGRWVPAAGLVVVALAAFLFMRTRHREPPKPPAPAATAAVAAVSAEPAPRLPVLTADEPPVDRTEDDASAVDVQAAKTERTAAVHALEKHDLPRALELATDATAHDPADAEGWLILGATHIYRGDFAASKKAFKTCVDIAKVGRRDNCAALLR